MVVGDFNAHLGELGGVKGVRQTNPQGLLLFEMMLSCHLSVATLDGLSEGPGHSYESSVARTTVDFTFMNVEASSLLLSCKTHECADLNTSDHLPQSSTLSISAIEKCVVSDARDFVLDWQAATRDEDIAGYEAEVRHTLLPFLNTTFDDVVQVDEELRNVAALLVDAAKNTLLQVSRRKRRRYSDHIQQQLCCESREARKAWTSAGCPLD